MSACTRTGLAPAHSVTSRARSSLRASAARLGRLLACAGALSAGCGDGPGATVHESQRDSATAPVVDDASSGPSDGGTPPSHAPSDAGAAGGEVPDGEIATHLDGGMPIPEKPPAPAPDAAISGKPLGNSYAETEYMLERPEGLVGAFQAVQTLSTGTTRLFVNSITEAATDGGMVDQVRYGAADSVDGGLVWQKLTAKPRTFEIGPSKDDARTLVSKPFTYTLQARVAVDADNVFSLYIESVQSVWTATFSADYENITTGALYGIITRTEAEHRPITFLACGAGCGLNLGCSLTDQNYLSNILDCNGAKLDADVDGDGTADGYQMILSFKSQRVPTPSE
jgi:hypothetical protein